MNEKIWIEQPTQSAPLPPEAQEEFTLLMSLRLDQLLDASEEALFQNYLSQHGQCAQEWRRWQNLHQRFVHAPHMEPPIDFARQFATRLEREERQRQLWWGATVGTLFVLLWIGMVIGTVAFGALLVLNQPRWISDLIHNLAYFGASIQQGVAMWWNSFNTFLATPQAQGMGIAYLCMAIALLALWVRLLRRTTRIEDIVSMV